MTHDRDNLSLFGVLITIDQVAVRKPIKVQGVNDRKYGSLCLALPCEVL